MLASQYCFLCYFWSVDHFGIWHMDYGMWYVVNGIKNKKKQEELGGGVRGGGKKLPVTKHDRTSLNRPESVSYLLLLFLLCIVVSDIL